MVVRGCYPQTQDICTKVFDNFFRCNTVAGRFMHGFALAVYYPTVSADILVRSNAFPSNRGQQRGLEPTAVLVSAFQVQIAWPSQIVTGGQNSSMGCTGVEPNVHNIGFFTEFFAAAFFTFGACRQNFGCFADPPGVRTFFCKEFGYSFDGFFVDMSLTAFFTVEDRNWNTPSSLTGNTPVRTSAYHVFDTTFTPTRDPVDAFDCFQSFLFEVIDRAEPLFGCTVNDRMFTSPAVWILMHDFFNSKHVTGFSQISSNHFVCFIGGQTYEFACCFGHMTFCINRNNDTDFWVAVYTNFKVFGTVTRSGMNTAGTAVESYMVTNDNQRITIHKWMFANHVFQFFTLNGTDDFVFSDVSSFHGSFDQLTSHNIVFAVCFHYAVLVFRTYADCHVAWQSPGGGGPDHEVGFGQICTQSCQFAFIVFYIEFNVNREAWIFLVFDFSFCQSSLTFRTPVNRFQTFIDVAVGSHFTEYFDLFCFELRFQSQIRIIEVTQYAQTLKLLTLSLNVMQSVFCTDLSQFNSRDIAGNTCFFAGFQLDWQTMSIPAWNVWSFEAAHVFLTNDEVFQNFVQSGTQMDITVCIWRAVMQNIQRFALIIFDHFVIEVVFLPFCNHTRFTLRQSGSHIKISLNKVQSLIVILSHFYSLLTI